MKTLSILRTPDKVQIISGIHGKKEIRFLEEQTDVQTDFTVQKDGMSVSVTAGHTPVQFLRLRWYESFPEGTRFLGDAHERAYGNLGFEGYRPERIMPWYFAAVNSGTATGCGVKVRPNCFASWQTDPSGITLWLDMRCGSNGLILNGKTLFLAQIVQRSAQEEIFSFLQCFCRQMASNPVLPQEPVYGFNNWYYAYGNSSAEKILRDTALLCSLTEGLDNRPFMVIDDGWQLGSTSGQCTGTLGTLTNYKFPDMKALADQIKQMGAKPGLWLRPLKQNPKEKHPAVTSEKCDEYLDPSLDESLALVAADVDRVTKEWGYMLIKYDFSTFDIMGRFFFTHQLQLTDGDWSLKNPMTNAQAIKRLYQTVHNHANGAVIIGCNCVSHLGAGYFELHRSGDDTSGRDWERTRFMGINTLAFRLPQHKAFFEVDADCVGEDGKYSWDLNRQWLDLLANSGTPLFVSLNPDCITPQIAADVKAAFQKAAVQISVCRPLHLTQTTMPTFWEIDGAEKRYHFDDIMGAEITLE